MGDIITQWLREKLGIIVDVHDDAFLKMVLNGQLIALLLRQYNIITEEQLRSLDIAPDSSQQIAAKVTMWLKALDPSLEEDAVNCFVKGKLSSTVKLFYRLYLLLKGKDQLHFAAQNIVKQKLRPSNARFVCTKVLEKSEDDAAMGPHPLSRPLQEHYQIIQWHKERYKTLLQRCKEARNAYIACFDRKEKQVSEVKLQVMAKEDTKTTLPGIDTCDAASLRESYNELKLQEKKALEMDVTGPNPKLAEKIVKHLQQKYKQEQEERAMKSQMETILVTKIWNETVRLQEQSIEMELSKKILKQSNYEKQMASKIFEIREQKNVMAENRSMIQKEIRKQMDDALLEYVFMKEKGSGDDRYRYYFERDRILELHRRIYAEKQRLMKERRQKMCTDILEDMVDISLKLGEFKEAFCQDMTPKMKKDLADLFVEGKSIFDVIEDTETIIDYVPLTDFDEEILLEEIDRQNAIDIRNFEDYCNFVWPYELETHAPDFLANLDEIKLAMNILGHIIFRLLLTKYPKPPPPIPPDIPKVEAAVCITTVPDLTILAILDKLLSERKIRVIQLEEVVNYCLAAYKDEVNTEAPPSQFEAETQEELKDVKKKKKGKKEKKRKKDPAPKGKKPHSKGKKKSEAEKEPEEEPPFRDEMEQTPRVFPCEEHVMSAKALLGKSAFEALNLGETLGDDLLVKMFVEFLKSLKDIYGWVLVNYPQNFKQAVLLEEALTAKKVPVSQSRQLEPQNLPEEAGEEITPETVTTVTLAYTEGEGDSLVSSNFNTFRQEDIPVEFLTETSPSDKFPSKTQSLQFEAMNEVAVEPPEAKLEDLADLTTRPIQQPSLDPDKNAEFRKSLLLTNPDIIPPEEDYDTYLTALIKLKQDVDSLCNPHVVDMDEEEPDALTPLDAFYQNQGCYYTLYYKTLDFAAIKHLGKLILGEYPIPPKTSVQIFGDTVLYLEADVIQADTVNETTAVKEGTKKKKKEKKKPKPKSESAKSDTTKDKGSKKGKGKDTKKGKEKGKGKSEDKASDKKKDKKKGKKDKKGGKKGKKGKIEEEAEVAIERADKETQIPTPAPESVVEFVEIPEPVPGSKDYIYVDLPVPDFLQVSLATLWENVEEVYVYDFRELFFRRRLVWKTVVPYMDFVRRYMTDFIARPDEKQIHVFNFQKLYNSIDADLRDDDEMKAELHCRVYEFREKLWGICDQRMKEAEEERNNVIVQDWIARQACELTNVYVTAMQLEIDRCTDTMQLLDDYYMAMVTKMPTEGDVLEKTLLDQSRLTASMDFDGASTYKEFVRNMMVDCNFQLEETPFHKAVRNDLNTALGKADSYEDSSKKEITTIDTSLQPPKKGKAQKQTKHVKNEKKWPKFTEPDPEVKEQGPKLIAEWTAVIGGEKLRTMLRLNMLMSLFTEDINDMFNCGLKTFHGLFNDIKDRYERELESVERCCQVISRAIEEEMPIQPMLIIKGDTFYIDPDVMLFEDPLPTCVETIVEYEQQETFTINQLEKFVMIMLQFAPRSLIQEQAFSFLLQDMIVYIPEDGSTPAVPEIWRKLSYKNMNRLTYEFFGNTEKIDWKDFVLYNLYISFPTEDEMMDMRWQFRELDEDRKEYVYDYQYDSIKFWYEKEFDKTNPQDLDRLNRIKKILFRMYALNEETVNYTQLLLGFCKGATTVEGVAKALALSMGKLVCHQKEIGDAFVETLRERKRQQLEEELQFQLQEKEKFSTVAEVIDSLIDTTVHECDSCYLTDLNGDDLTKASPIEEVPAKSAVEDAFVSESMEYLDRLIKSYGPVDMYEEEYCGEFYGEEFSNVEIGYEAYRNPPLVYYLLFDVIFTVLMAAMPWQAAVQNVGEVTFRQKLADIYDQLKNHEFDDIVLMHEFLNSQQFEELMKNNNKFLVIDPRKVVRQLLGDNV